MLAGADVARSGAGPDEVVSTVRRRAAASTTYFYVDSWNTCGVAAGLAPRRRCSVPRWR